MAVGGVERGAKVTPMLAQYLRLKERHRDAILMFRLGDFYEMFFEDAERAAAILDITLTARNKHDPQPIPLCGVPFHSVDPYVQKLLGAGCKVAICEQVEDPKTARGLVDRDVVRVITPGTVLEEESLDPRRASFLGILGAADDGLALVVADVSTGDVRVAEFPASGSDGRDALVDAVGEEISRLGVKELVAHAGLEDAVARLERRVPGLFRSLVPADWYEADGADAAAEAALAEALPASRAAFRALGAYLAETCRGRLDHLRAPERYRPSDALVLDEVSRTTLGLVPGGRGDGDWTLLRVLDRTGTPMGSRTLRRWLLGPLTTCAAIGRRLDAVEILVESPELRADLRVLLAGMGDLERLVGRVGARRATPRDLGRLATALERVARLRARLDGLAGLAGELGTALDPAPELRARIEALLVDEPPAALRAGPIVRSGHHLEVDELRALARDGKGWVAALETRERARTGIGSLKIRYNRVYGYAIEVTRANLGLVPPEYIRKQTLAGAERFVTPELKDHERRLLGAEERLRELETALFAALVEEAAARQGALGENARVLGVLDTLLALAETAHEGGWVRPALDHGDALVIRGGRHPVVEAALRAERFVPNDCVLDAEHQIMLITGPNMAGKSTYLRQTALIVVLAQMGSFVPATEARVGVCDRIFTRVGAADHLAAGESTFMVEMRETAQILRDATPKSLVLLDEIGRGTSTFDGIAIAWAVAEHLHDMVPGAKTLFATHYYELTELARTRPRIHNHSVAVREWKGEIMFLRRIVAGPASRSYGVDVARLAGLPPTVLERARALLAILERGDAIAEGERDRAEAGQLPLFTPRASSVDARLMQLEPDRMTPLEALQELHALVEAVRGGGTG